jgi:hypothetical protein
MADTQDADFGRTWLYRATVRGKEVAQATHASDITACQWAAQEVWPGLVPRPSDEEGMTVERQAPLATGSLWSA